MHKKNLTKKCKYSQCFYNFHGNLKSKLVVFFTSVNAWAETFGRELNMLAINMTKAAEIKEVKMFVFLFCLFYVHQL